MALTAIKGGLRWPDYHSRYTSGLGVGGALLIDAAGEKAAFIFVVPKTGTIDRVSFRTGTVTTSQTLKVGLETVDATTGFPTGTAYGGMVAGTQASPASNTLYEVTLGTGASATVGDLVAMVIEFNATVGNLNIAMMSGLRDMNQGIPYGALLSGAGPTWAKQSDLNTSPLFAIRYSDGSYEFVGAFAVQTVTSNAFNSGSTPDERGNKITLNAEIEINGMWGIFGTTENCDQVLYDSTNAVVVSVTHDKDIIASANANLRYTRCAPTTLAAGTYRLVLKPTTTTNVTINSYSVLSNGQLDSNPGGSDMVSTTRTDAGAWTDTTTEQFWGLGLMISKIHASGGGGGLAANPIRGFTT